MTYMVCLKRRIGAKMFEEVLRDRLVNIASAQEHLVYLNGQTFQ